MFVVLACVALNLVSILQAWGEGPWSVGISTINAGKFCGDMVYAGEDGHTHSACEGYPKYYQSLRHEGKEILGCGNDKEACEDVAYSLNHAHEMRVEQEEIIRDTVPPVEIWTPHEQPCSRYGTDGCTDDENQK